MVRVQPQQNKSLLFLALDRETMEKIDGRLLRIGILLIILVIMDAWMIWELGWK